MTQIGGLICSGDVLSIRVILMEVHSWVGFLNELSGVTIKYRIFKRNIVPELSALQ